MHSDGNFGEAELKGLLKRFRLQEVLDEDTSTKSIWLLGTIEENEAVLVLERLAFSGERIEAETRSKGPPLLGACDLHTMEHNDIYSWATGMVDAAVLRPDIRIALTYPATQKHIDKHRRLERRWVKETPELYNAVTKPFIESQPAERIQWIYNILDKKVEAERTLFEDPDPKFGFIILPDLKWDTANTDSLYLVAICHNHRIRSLRDLTRKHLPLLNNIRNKATQVAQSYGVADDQLRLYVHYQPSYYHFHVHITTIKLDGRGMLAGRAHLLDTVIDNIANIAADYYQMATIPFVLGSSDQLWSSWPKHF